MKKVDRIGRFKRFKRLRYQPTNQPTDGHDLYQKCEDALKKDASCIHEWAMYRVHMGRLEEN